MKQVLGKVSQDIVDKWHLDEHKNKKIVMYLDRKDHSKKHIKQYPKKEDFYYTMANLDKVIKNPDYVYCDISKKGLEYYKKLKNNVLVVVRISSGNELKVRSVYPVAKAKIINRKKKEKQAIEQILNDKYTYQENE